MPRDTLAPVAESRSLALARLLSVVFNPMVAGIASYFAVGYYALDSGENGLSWAGVAVLLQVLPPLLFYLVQLRRGAFSDPDVSVRHERNQMYLFATFSVLISIGVLAALGVPRPLLALAVGTLLIGVVCGIVNLFWKISMHGAGMGSLATVTLLYTGTPGLALWALAAAVGWARVRTRNHTPLQVLGGLALSAVMMAVSFAFIAQ
ncbi:MAG: hypothetical protein DIU80_012010 [Chloroflexota bacterium]